MKNFLLALALALGVIGSIVAFVATQKVEKLEKGSLDSLAVMSMLEQQKNPAFTSVDQVLKYRSAIQHECFIDSVMGSLPTQTITDVATVIINKKGSATQAEIVEEFRQNKSVYTNLHPTPTENTDTSNTAPPVNTAAQDSLNNVLKYVGHTSINYKDTVIDGKPMKEKTVTHVTYE